MKKCRRCHKLKNLIEFKYIKSNRRATCKNCLKLIHSLDEVRYKKKKHKNKKSRLKSLYNMSLNAYTLLLKKQHYKCAICGKLHSNNKPLCVDHDHKTGMVRGLLCLFCNSALGFLQDNPDIIDNANTYLRERGGGATI